jgi:hypothetical protein
MGIEKKGIMRGGHDNMNEILVGPDGEMMIDADRR